MVAVGAVAGEAAQEAAPAAPAARAPLPETKIARTPTVLQLESVECGAAALSMVLAHHGRWVPLEQMRVDCGVSRDGSKAGGLLRAARMHGMVARGFKKEPNAIAQLPLPCIVFWNFNHFVVLEGFRAGRALLNDPARGRRAVDAAEFDQAFTGVVLTFEPGPEFTRGGHPPSVLRSLRQYLDGFRLSIGVVLLIGLALVIPGLVMPWLLGRFVDEVLVAHMDGVAGPLLTGLIVAAIARAALVGIQARVLMDTFGRAVRASARRFFSHALRLPMTFYSQRSAGEIAARVDLNERVAETISADLAHLALDCLTASFFLVLMVRLEPRLAVVVVGCLALELFAWRGLARRTAEASQELSVQAGKLAGMATGGLANIESVKAGGQETALFLKWIGLQVQYVNASIRAQRYLLTLGQAPAILGLIAQLAVLGLGAVMIMQETFSVGDLVAFQVLLAGFAAPVHALFAHTQKLQTLRGDLAHLALDCLTASFFLVLMVRLEPRLAVVVVGCLALELFAWRGLARRTAEASQELSVQAGKLAGMATGGLANIESVKAGGQETALFLKWIGLQVQYVNASIRAQRYLLTLGQAPAILGLIAQLAVLGLGAVMIMQETFSVGDLVAFQVLLAGFAAPVHALFAHTQKLQTLRGDLARLDDVLHHQAEDDVDVHAVASPVPAAPIAGIVEFRNVTFGYNRGEAPLIEDFSLTIKAGGRVALVGASGSGKSTVAKLAAGLCKPWSGEILFDGQQRGMYERSHLADAVAYVDQDVTLFEGSVRDNLTLWQPAPEEVLRSALRDAAIENDILIRPGGIDAPLQEGARNLSGGQRQRLEIARALVRNPRVLILDEATSALDPTSEAQVEQRLRSRNLTCLVVAHRLSTVRDADEIIVLDGGRVAERGTYAELKAQGGRFAELVATESVDTADV